MRCSCTGACRQSPYRCPVTNGNFAPYYDEDWGRKRRERFTVTVEDIMQTFRKIAGERRIHPIVRKQPE